MSLPEAFVNQTKTLLGTEAPKVLATIQAHEPPVSIRLNGQKLTTTPDLAEVPWAPNGFYLPERPVFTKDPWLHAGAYYVQEASSMMLEQAVAQSRPEHPIRVLDLCAAPGGKSTHLLSMLHANDWLVANEVIQARARILHENLAKWGSANAVVTCDDPASFGQLEGFFDLVVVDAPCSGEGMFRKDPAAIAEWSPEHVQLCADRQRRILADVWDTLTYDGVLIYSTCTFNTDENEQMLDWLLQNFEAELIAINLQQEWGARSFTDSAAGHKMIPGLVQGEGYCFFVLRKKNGADRWEAEGLSRRKARKQRGKRVAKEIEVKGLRSVDGLKVIAQDQLLVATPFPQELDALRKHVRVEKSGVLLGEQKKNKVVPAHEFALSDLLESDSYPAVELTYEQALSYLMKAPFDMQADRGFQTVQYAGQTLGWINHLGNRFNNLYPANWRIQKDFRAEKPWTLQTYFE
ncbi:RsmF rRNA methyltransferase first C-terminal domain-containing protein [Marinoscillum furvescens]|uniref:16S rRNA C967 or C1407 C5-methylase (RsmB/RsmF family) n=1 Tax=Marinoscillum furvescens DSM 4134 TaxID=1122208 RepID=A0A3D9L2E1_MARFU|nr:RsmF rRNA methyltransferase first C-terminal domain-containing protein [Marinoscillum furvescens]RED97867.1 16S rRNA C967 or C1407 C5-methylase (RsmB/RsmF family) [Marinoscillum furvescens DSM 4134]